MSYRLDRIIKLAGDGYDFSSTQFNLPKSLSKLIYNYGKKLIPDEDVFDSSDPQFGREKKGHITVKYGLHTNNPDDVKEVVSGFWSVVVSLGNISYFDNKDFDVVIIEVESDKLEKLNEKISSEMKVTDTHPGYTPHITIAYVEKGKGSEYKGDDFFKGKKVKFHSLVFSAKDGRKFKIGLEGGKEVEEEVELEEEKNKESAVYRDNLGFEEMYKFYEKADSDEIAILENLLNSGLDDRLVWLKYRKLVNQVLGVDLK